MSRPLVAVSAVMVALLGTVGCGSDASSQLDDSSNTSTTASAVRPEEEEVLQLWRSYWEAYAALLADPGNTQLQSEVDALTNDTMLTAVQIEAARHLRSNTRVVSVGEVEFIGDSQIEIDGGTATITTCVLGNGQLETTDGVVLAEPSTVPTLFTATLARQGGWIVTSVSTDSTIC